MRLLMMNLSPGSLPVNDSSLTLVKFLLPLDHDVLALPATLGLIDSLCHRGALAHEVVAVDDASRDGTAAEARRFAHVMPLWLIQHGKSMGRAMAFRTALAAAADRPPPAPRSSGSSQRDHRGPRGAGRGAVAVGTRIVARPSGTEAGAGGRLPRRPDQAAPGRLHGNHAPRGCRGGASTRAVPAVCGRPVPPPAGPARPAAGRAGQDRRQGCFGPGG